MRYRELDRHGNTVLVVECYRQCFRGFLSDILEVQLFLVRVAYDFELDLLRIDEDHVLHEPMRLRYHVRQNYVQYHEDWLANLGNLHLDLRKAWDVVINNIKKIIVKWSTFVDCTPLGLIRTGS